MSLLGLSEYSPLPPLEPERPEKPKSAAIAFLLSVLLPGIGQVYANRRTAGWVTFTFFYLSLLMGIATLIAKQFNLSGIAIFIAISLYIFGFLDAYFSALEYNQGISTYLIGGNPRIACFLNFLTNGFGYFYLGDRGKGIAMFLIVGVLGRSVKALSKSPGFTWFDFILLLLQFAFALDGYRIARKRLFESFPQLANHSWRSSIAGHLTPAVPIAFAIIIILPVIALVSLGLFAQTATGINLSAMDVQSTSNGVAYENKLLGLRLLLPDGWQVTPQPGNTNFNAEKVNGNCKVILIREFSFRSPESFQAKIEHNLSLRPGLSVYGHSSGTLGNLPAAIVRVGVGTSFTEQVVSAKAGLAMYTLIGMQTGEDETCPAELDQIRNSFSTKH